MVDNKGFNYSLLFIDKNLKDYKEPDWRFILFDFLPSDLRELVNSNQNKISFNFKYFIDGVNYEYGITKTLNLKMSIANYISGAKNKCPYCLFRLYFIHRDHADKFEIKSDDNSKNKQIFFLLTSSCFYENVPWNLRFYNICPFDLLIRHLDYEDGDMKKITHVIEKYNHFFNNDPYNIEYFKALVIQKFALGYSDAEADLKNYQLVKKKCMYNITENIKLFHTDSMLFYCQEATTDISYSYSKDPNFKNTLEIAKEILEKELLLYHPYAKFFYAKILIFEKDINNALKYLREAIKMGINCRRIYANLLFHSKKTKIYKIIKNLFFSIIYGDTLALYDLLYMLKYYNNHQIFSEYVNNKHNENITKFQENFINILLTIFSNQMEDNIFKLNLSNFKLKEFNITDLYSIIAPYYHYFISKKSKMFNMNRGYEILNSLYLMKKDSAKINLVFGKIKNCMNKQMEAEILFESSNGLYRSYKNKSPIQFYRLAFLSANGFGCQRDFELSLKFLEESKSFDPLSFLCDKINENTYICAVYFYDKCLKYIEIIEKMKSTENKINIISSKESTTSLNEVGEKISRISTEKLCVICMSNLRCSLFLPCAHKVCCETCGLNVFKSTAICPICKSHIENYIKKIYE